jgi:ribosomal protein S18 acetylase RimI-like enzyme
VSLAFRRALDPDWAIIWPTWHEVATAGDTYVYDPDTDSDTAQRMWLAPEPHETWLAFEGSTLMGFYHLAPNHDGPGAHIANASFMVPAAGRGRGTGRALVVDCLARATERGYRGMQFNAVAASNTHAIALYRHLGFTTIGVVPGGFRHPDAGFVDLHIMYRDL